MEGRDSKIFYVTEAPQNISARTGRLTCPCLCRQREESTYSRTSYSVDEKEGGENKAMQGSLRTAALCSVGASLSWG